MEGLRYPGDLGVSPYMFEPTLPSGSQTTQSSDGPALATSESEVAAASRAGNVDWCSCKCCKEMNDERSSLCCQEVIQITRKQKRPICVTATKRFRDVCLNRTVLDVSLIQRGKSAPAGSSSEARKRALRHAAYFLFAVMTWREQAKNNRRILPSCVLSAIRRKFPSADGTYTGFKLFWHLVAIWRQAWFLLIVGKVLCDVHVY